MKSVIGFISKCRASIIIKKFDDAKGVIRSRNSKKDRQAIQWANEKEQKENYKYAKSLHKTKE